MSIYFQDIPSRISLSAIDVTVTIEGFRYFLHTSFLRLYSESVAIFWSRCHTSSGERPPGGDHSLAPAHHEQCRDDESVSVSIS